MGLETRGRQSIHKVGAKPWRSSLLVLNLIGNCGLVLYSHIGLSFELFTNRQAPEACGRRLSAAGCSASDLAVMNDTQQLQVLMGGAVQQCGVRLLASAECPKQKLREMGIVSPTCSDCTAVLMHCSAGCIADCSASLFGDACFACQMQRSCIEPWEACSGVDYAVAVLGRSPGGPAPAPAPEPGEEETTYYSLGETGRISFTNSVRKVWNSEAYGLALLIAIASGVNPYLECVLLAVAWFVPMLSARRARLLWWVNRVGRWSFFDIFIVVFLCSGLNITLAGGALKLAVESKPSIYCFGIATIWARIMGVYVETAHRCCPEDDAASARMACRCVAKLSKRSLEMLLGVSSLALCVLGCVAMAVPFITFTFEVPMLGAGEERTFSAFTLGLDAGQKDLAGAVSALLLAAPFLLWGMLVPIVVSAGLFLGLAAGRVGGCSVHGLIGALEMLGSAASLDVLVLAAGITARHFGGLVTKAIDCIGTGFVAESSIGLGFMLMCAAAPAQWVMQEAALALHDRPPDRQRGEAGAAQLERDAEGGGGGAEAPKVEKAEPAPDDCRPDCHNTDADAETTKEPAPDEPSSGATVEEALAAPKDGRVIVAL